MEKIKIGTRASKLALWQANFVAQKLSENFPVELVKIQTTGDKILDAPLAKIGGKGLFTKEIENALAEKKIDLAVHSLKDVPSELPAGFEIAAITQRENPFDAFVSNNFDSLEDLPSGAVIGTSSLRRAAQILNLRADLKIENLRGNVDTRLKKLDAGNFDAVILAAAGLERLGYSSRIKKILTEIIPAAGQGALAIEIRAGDSEIADAVKILHDKKTCAAVKIERDKILARAVIASIDGRKIIRETAENLDGESFAARMLNNGGREILRELAI